MTAPGWYPDPAGNGQQRYFDGNEWTGSTAPPYGYTPPYAYAPPPAHGSGRITIHYGFALLAVFSLIGTAVPGFSLMAADDGEGYGVTMGVMWLLWGGMWTLVWTAFAVHHTLKSR